MAKEVNVSSLAYIVEEALITYVCEHGKEEFLKQSKAVKTGKMYRFNGTPYIASAPNETPAFRTGRLSESLIFTKVAPNRVKVYDTSGYGLYLEEGTSRIAPRKGVYKATEKVLNEGWEKIKVSPLMG